VPGDDRPTVGVSFGIQGKGRKTRLPFIEKANKGDNLA
jgi:hypothetical protein